MKEKIYSIGIDVSKKTLDICFLGEGFTALKEFKISNDVKGIEEILKNLKKYRIDKSASFVMESTGSYHILLALMLIESNHSVKVFNPIINNKYTASSIRKCKTDKIDAKRIAEIGILERIPECNLSKDMFFLRRKVSMLKQFTKQRQVMKSSINQFSEDCSTLKEEPSMFLCSSQETLNQLENTIKILEKEIQNEGSCLNGFELITDIKGVSKRSASIILSHIADKDFRSKNALAAFAGLDISTKQSGTSIHGKGKLSKRGNRMLRKTLTQVSWGLMMHNEVFQQLAAYYKSKGKHYFEIMTILARKLLHIIYGMMKNNSHFDPAKILIPKQILTPSV